MSENNIYEITKMIQNKDNIERDLNEAFNIITTMFQEKYINKINDVFIKKHTNCCAQPTKEVQLLNALKAFAPPEAQSQFDGIIETMLLATTLDNIQAEVNSVKVSSMNYEKPVDVKNRGNRESRREETSIHEDGIYDIDDKCMLHKKNQDGNWMNLCLLMAALGQKQR